MRVAPKPPAIARRKRQALQAGEERRGSSASQSNGCYFDPVIWEAGLRISRDTGSKFYPIHAARVCQYRTSGFPEQGAREEKEDWEGDWDDERMANWWYEGAAFGSAVDGEGAK